MKISRNVLFALIVAPLWCVAAYSAEIKLYPTGPAQDSAFVRFVDGRGSGIQIRATGSDATLQLDAHSRASAYFPVAGNSSIEGQLIHDAVQKNIALDMEPGEFVTALGVVDEEGMRVYTLREKPDDFTAVRASIAFYNLSESCRDTTLGVVGRSVNLFTDVMAGDHVRRHINPVPLRVQLLCAGEPVGPVLDLGGLQAGERHSLFLLPGDPATGFFHVKDSVIH